MKFHSTIAVMFAAGLMTPLMATAQGMTPEAMAQRAASLGMPKGVVQISPCVPQMGEHWARLSDMPFGPIYGADGSAVTFVEVMIDQADFKAGKSWSNQLRAAKGQTIDHIDIHFEAKGHDGYEIPHYDIHAYYVPHSEEKNIC